MKPWAIAGGIVGFALLCACLLAVAFSPALNPPRPASPLQPAAPRFRVHQSDLRGPALQDGTQYIRCHLCGGKGASEHWSRLPNGTPYRDGFIECPQCGGSGTMDAAAVGGYMIVPDTEPTDYAD